MGERPSAVEQSEIGSMISPSIERMDSPSGRGATLKHYITEAFGGIDGAADAVKECLAKLNKEGVHDVAILKDAWDEVKAPLPGVARHLINERIKKDIKPYTIDQPTAVSPKIWAYAAAVCLVIFAGPCILGALTWNQKPETASEYPVALWYQVHGPLMLITVVEIIVGSMVAPKIGWDMIAESSADADLREALKASMTTQGLISALFLTVVWALQGLDPIQGDDTLIINQWYQGLLVLSIALNIIGLIASSFCLLFLEPLTGNAALDFVYNNFMYFGEPLALSIFAFANTLFATIIWVFGSYGPGAGALAVFCFFYCGVRVIVIYSYVSAWENPEIEDLRKLRDDMKTRIATTGGVDAAAAAPSAAPSKTKDNLKTKDKL